MDAPTYPPAIAYQAPVRIAYARTTANTSIKQLLADPAVKAILLKEIPGFESRVDNAALKPHLDNFAPRSLVQFGVFNADALDRVDARLRALETAK